MSVCVCVCVCMHICMSFLDPKRSYFLELRYLAAKTVMPPLAAAIVVFMATSAARAPVTESDRPNVEPQLKPYHPNQEAEF